MTSHKKISIKYNLLKGFSCFRLNSTEFRGGLWQNECWLFLGKYVTDGLWFMSFTSSTLKNIFIIIYAYIQYNWFDAPSVSVKKKTHLNFFDCYMIAFFSSGVIWATSTVMSCFFSLSLWLRLYKAPRINQSTIFCSSVFNMVSLVTSLE